MDIPGTVLEQISAWLTNRYGLPCRVHGHQALAGGCMHHAVRLETGTGMFFLKWNDADQAQNFSAEKRGLQLLAKHAENFTAVPLTHGSNDRFSFLLTEFIEQGSPAPAFWQDFGQRLAGLHRNTAPLFGLDHDNFIGRLPQSNRQHPDFASFFAGERLRPQVQRARAAGLIGSETGKAFERLCRLLPELLPDEPPSLLHGDLWQGNFLCGPEGRAVLIDPAVYYGHREAEIAFTQLFGGFFPEFYAAYEESFPLAPGWRERTGLFNLYPLLVHLNLFGRSYLPEIRQILDVYG